MHSSQNSSTPLLCVGHSHLAAVAAAAAAVDEPMVALNFWELPDAVIGSGSELKFTAEIEKAVTTHGGTVFSFIGGAIHNVIGMVAHPRPFDFVLPWTPELPLDPNAEYLPYLAVRRLVETLSAEYLAQMARLRQLCRAKLVQVSPPPPSANQRRLAHDIPWSMYPEMTDQVASAGLRRKLWLLQGRVLADWCVANNAEFLQSANAATDKEGYLLDDCYSDGAHANQVYGALVLRQLRDYR